MTTFLVESYSVFKFSKDNFTGSAHCEENIQYECPRLLSSFCRREVAFQRNAIMNNLKNHFVHNNSI